MSLSFYLVLWVSGGNDVLASIFRVSVNNTTYAGRIGLLVIPPLVYVATKRLCLALQRSDEELMHHGIESGTIRRLPSGEFVEETVPLPVPYRVALTRVEPSEVGHGHTQLANGEKADIVPSGPGHEESQYVEMTRTKSKGFFRDKGASKASTRTEPAEQELEGSGQQ
jgi:hypothetical protein